MTSSIEFKLFAPNNEAANLIGSFSNWQEIPMAKGEDGYFRTQVALKDGTYQYKFLVQSKSPSLQPNQWVYVTDPYATNVIDDYTQNGVLRIKDGEKIVDTYVWQYDNQPLPANHELVIYELHVADFCADESNSKCGKFTNIIQKLDYLSELGINAIELMPINEYQGNYSWGYTVRHFFSVESSYGSTFDLKRLVDECHARGMRVILDGIYNHCDEENPLLLIDRDYWYYHGAHYPDDPANYWGPEFNYNNYDEKLNIRPAWQYIGDVVRYWIKEYHIDGIRYDAVRQLANNEFLYWITQEAKKAAVNKPFYNIAEYIPEDPQIVAPKGPMDSCWHESFRIFAINAVCGRSFELEKLRESLDAKRQGFSGATSVINYLGSHDREHLLRELSDCSLSNALAIKRAKLGATLQMTAMGVPMIWMGDEFGESKPKTKTVTQHNRIQWHLLKNDLNQNLFNHYKALIDLRKHNSALQTENIDFFHEDVDNKVLAYVRWNDQGSSIVVIANFSNNSFSDYRISNFPASGIWFDWTNKSDVEFEQHEVTINLGDCEAKVFIYSKDK